MCLRPKAIKSKKKNFDFDSSNISQSIARDRVRVRCARASRLISAGNGHFENELASRFVNGTRLFLTSDFDPDTG